MGYKTTKQTVVITFDMPFDYDVNLFPDCAKSDALLVAKKLLEGDDALDTVDINLQEVE